MRWEEQVERITYSFGWDAGDNPEHRYFVEPMFTAAVGGIDVYTSYSHQVQYLLEHFRAEVLLPMHRGGVEEEAADFPEVMAERGYESIISVPRRRGDRWVIGG